MSVEFIFLGILYLPKGSSLFMGLLERILFFFASIGGSLSFDLRNFDGPALGEVLLELVLLFLASPRGGSLNFSGD